MDWNQMKEKKSHHEQNTGRIERKTVQNAHRTVFEPSKTRLQLPDTALQSFQIHSILAAYRVPRGVSANLAKTRFRKKEISYSAVYLHFAKWSRDGSLKKVWHHSILTIQDDLNLSELNLDGTHTLAKKGGQAVAYQRRKKGKTSNILPIIGWEWLCCLFNRYYRRQS